MGKGEREEMGKGEEGKRDKREDEVKMETPEEKRGIRAGGGGNWTC